MTALAQRRRAIAGGAGVTYDVVQSATNGAVGTSVTATLGSAPTVGNTLVARVVALDSGRMPYIAGFRPCDRILTGQGSAAIWYRQVQSGDGTTVTATHGTSQALVIDVEEVEGQLIPHKVARQTTSSVTTQTTGTTEATTEATAKAFAVMGLRNINTTDHTWTTPGYTAARVTTAGSGNSGRTIVTGDKDLHATGTQEATLTWTNIHHAYGAITVMVEGVDVPLGGYSNVVISDAPYSYYRLTEPAGGRFLYDESGAAHLELSGAPTHSITGPLPSETASKALRFDGTDDYATVPVSYTGNATIELWVRVPSLAAVQRFDCAFLTYQTDVHGTVLFPAAFDGPGTRWMLHYRDNTVTGQDYDIGAMPENTWEVWWLTVESGVGAKVYTNVAGTVTQVGTVRTNITQMAFNLHQLAKVQGASWAPFDLADVAVWRRVLSTAEMQDHLDAS